MLTPVSAPGTAHGLLTKPISPTRSFSTVSSPTKSSLGSASPSPFGKANVPVAPVEPDLTMDLLNDNRQELKEAEDLVASIDSERSTMREQSKQWHMLTDPAFTSKLQASTDRILVLDRQYEGAMELLKYRRLINDEVEACWAAQAAKQRKSDDLARAQNERRLAESREAQAEQAMLSARESEIHRKARLNAMLNQGPPEHVGIVLNSRLMNPAAGLQGNRPLGAAARPETQ